MNLPLHHNKPLRWLGAFAVIGGGIAFIGLWDWAIACWVFAATASIAQAKLGNT